MANPVFVPAIISALLTPNPATVGGQVLISVAAADLEAVPTTEVWVCGEVVCGEV